MNSLEFKSFWLKEKLRNVAPGEEVNIDSNNIHFTLEEDREMVANSGMILVPGWDHMKLFLLDQVVRQNDPRYVKEYENYGSKVNVNIKAFVVWARGSSLNRPIVPFGLE